MKTGLSVGGDIYCFERYLSFEIYDFQYERCFEMRRLKNPNVAEFVLISF